MEMQRHCMAIGHPLLARWLDALQAEPQAVASLYHDDAVLTTPLDTAQGRSAIASWLDGHARLLRRSRIVSVVTVSGSAGRLVFETRVRGPAGVSLLRHDWTFAHGLVERHGVTILTHMPGHAGA